MSEYQSVANDVKLGKDVKLAKFINLYGCTIGDGTKIGSFVEVQKNASIGKRCKISSHTFICEGVSIKDNCFIGHSVTFINDNNPRATTPSGELETDGDWMGRLVKTSVGAHAVIGSNATILGGISIGDNAMVGAGSVVTRDIPAGEVWVGNPAKFLRKRNEDEG